MSALEYVITTLEDGPVDFRPEFKVLEEEVKTNRERLLHPRGITTNLVRMIVNHGTQHLVIDRKNIREWSGRIYTGRPNVDAMTTTIPELALECDPADCAVYILFSQPYGTLSLVHAGRDGSINRILEKTIRETTQLLGAKLSAFTEDLQVVMAPAICGYHYRMQYVNVPKKDFRLWRSHIIGRYNTTIKNEKVTSCAIEEDIGVDFVGFNRARLLDLGVQEKNLELSKICTYGSPLYPSHYRAQQNNTLDSRFMVIAWMSDAFNG